jgi:hypothetical protein
MAHEPLAPDPAPPDDLRVGTVTVTGGLVAGAEHAVMRMKNGFRACIALGSADDGFRLTLDVHLAENGSVLSARATHAVGLGPAQVECIERRAQTATFRPPAGGQAHVFVPLSSPATGGS